MKLNTETFDKLKTLNKYDLIIFLIPCLIFLYYLHVFDPGILTNDSYRQLYQISTGIFDNWHPFFHTFIEMLCLKVYSNTKSIAILQIIIFSTMWMIICKYNRNENQKNNNTLIIQIIFTLVISLIPMNAVFSITLVKDILFCYFLMFLCFLIQVLIDRKGKIGWGFVVVISIVMALVANIRLNGLYVIIPFLVVLGIYLYRKDKENKTFLTIPALTILLILSIMSLNMIYDVKDFHFDSGCDVVSSILADYDLHLDLDSADRDKIHQLMSEKDIKTNYQTVFKDPLRNNAVNFTVWRENKLTYMEIALKYSLKHPKFFVKHMFKSAPITWKIVRDHSWKGVTYYSPDKMEETKKNFYSKRNRTPVGNYDNASQTNNGTPEFEMLNSILLFAKDNTIANTLLNSPALYMYLAIVLLAVLYFITRTKDILLIYLPNLLNICTIFISIPAQLNRYLYSNYLVFYLLVIIFICVLMNKTKNNTSAISNSPNNTQSPEELE